MRVEDVGYIDDGGLAQTLPMWKDYRQSEGRAENERRFRRLRLLHRAVVGEQVSVAIEVQEMVREHPRSEAGAVLVEEMGKMSERQLLRKGYNRGDWETVRRFSASTTVSQQRESLVSGRLQPDSRFRTMFASDK